MKINKADFLGKLESLQYGLTKRETIEQSSCFCFLEGRIHTFNEEVACYIKSGLEKEIKGAVVAEPLLKILRKVNTEEIDIDFTDSRVNIKNKGEKFWVRVEKEVNLPINMVEKPKEWKELPEGFCEAINLVQYCAGTDVEKFVTTCVHIHPDFIEAIDLSQFCRYKISTNIKNSVIVRQLAIKNIVSLGMVKICETTNWIHFKNLNNLVFSCRRYKENYPDISKFFDIEGTKIVLPKGLGIAAEKAGIFSSENLEDKTIIIELTENRVKIIGLGINGGYSKLYKISYPGPELKFSINPKILSDLVKKHTNCTITNNRIKVKSENYQYVSRLGKVE